MKTKLMVVMVLGCILQGIAIYADPAVFAAILLVALAGGYWATRPMLETGWGYANLLLGLVAVVVIVLFSPGPIFRVFWLTANISGAAAQVALWVLLRNWERRGKELERELAES